MHVQTCTQYVHVLYMLGTVISLKIRHERFEVFNF